MPPFQKSSLTQQSEINNESSAAAPDNMASNDGCDLASTRKRKRDEWPTAGDCSEIDNSSQPHSRGPSTSCLLGLTKLLLLSVEQYLYEQGVLFGIKDADGDFRSPTSDEKPAACLSQDELENVEFYIEMQPAMDRRDAIYKELERFKDFKPEAPLTSHCDDELRWKLFGRLNRIKELEKLWREQTEILETLDPYERRLGLSGLETFLAAKDHANKTCQNLQAQIRHFNGEYEKVKQRLKNLPQGSARCHPPVSIRNHPDMDTLERQSNLHGP